VTNRERFLAFAGFRPIDRVPRHAAFTGSLHKRMTEHLGKDPYEYFGIGGSGGASLTPPKEFVPPDYSSYHPEYTDGKDGFHIDGNGCGHLNHGFYHFTEYISPLRTAQTFEEIESYPITGNEGWSDRELRRAGERAHAAGDSANIFVGHMYESAWQVRGYQEFLMDLLTRREWAESILDSFCENNLRVAEAAGRAGYDCISTGDDVANQNSMMFSIELWRDVMKPRWAKVIAAARSHKPDIHAWYHSDGNIWDVIDDLVEIGITILNPVQPECVDPVKVRKRFGKRLAFDGCIGTQTTFPFGTPEDVKRTVNRLARDLDAKNGGLMLAPTHILEPEVPPENVVAFFEACDAL
jgi:uroporphyrinogen decarboxylase